MRKRKVEFSKKIFVGVAISTALIVIFFSCYSLEDRGYVAIDLYYTGHVC